MSAKSTDLASAIVSRQEVLADEHYAQQTSDICRMSYRFQYSDRDRQMARDDAKRADSAAKIARTTADRHHDTYTWWTRVRAWATVRFGATP